MMCFSQRRVIFFFIILGFIFFGNIPCLRAEQEINPDSVVSESGIRAYNPFGSLYRMHSWKRPILDHEGKPHKDGHIIQIIMDGGNGIQDPPLSNGNPGGDDSLADGNFYAQFINGEKNIENGLAPGMFIGMVYYIPYKANQSIYLRLWEGSDPGEAEYYQDSEKYETTRGNSGGAILSLQPEIVDQVEWWFGPSKKVERKR